MNTIRRNLPNLARRNYSVDPVVAAEAFDLASVVFGTGIAVVNLVNIKDPKADVATAKLAGFSLIKGAF